MPTLHQVVDTKKLAALTAGGTDFIRVKKGVVKGIAIRRDLNPQAPEVVLVGKGPQRQKRAQLFVDQSDPVPAFVKRNTDEWEYIGDYKAVFYSEAPEFVASYMTGKRTADSVAGVQILDPATTQTVSVIGGGFPDSRTRKAIETAAIDYVWSILEDRGYKVEDRQPENQGFDLLAVKGRTHLLVEVKGTDLPNPRFYLSRNEWTVGQREKAWRLFLVCSARSSPRLLEFTAQEVQDRFSFDALTWACIAK
jgi:hypothetical protein